MPAYEILQPERSPPLPLVVHLPHGGTAIPPDVRRGLQIDDERLDSELLALTDWHTPLLFAPAGVRAGGVAIVNRTSRLVVDPERLPDHREPLARLGLGAVYTRTIDGSPLRSERDITTRVALLDRYFQPWAEAVDRLVTEAVEHAGTCLLVDGHSFPSRSLPYEDASLARPDICLGFEAPHIPRDLIEAMTGYCETAGFSVAHNEPFAGSYVPLPRFGTDSRVRSVMVEVNRSQYVDESTGERSEGFQLIQRLVAGLINLAADEAEAAAGRGA